MKYLNFSGLVPIFSFILIFAFSFWLNSVIMKERNASTHEIVYESKILMQSRGQNADTGANLVP